MTLDLFVVAYTASHVCALDGSDKQDADRTAPQYWSLVLCMAYETAWMETRRGRRLAERPTRSADLVADQFEARADFVAKIEDAASTGMTGAKMTIACVLSSALLYHRQQRGNRDIFIPDLSYPNPDDDYASYYMVLTDEALEELDGHLEELAVVSPTLA